jgi:diguanylate cyclase (GGDEF)-like protein
MATHDALTGLPNKTMIGDRLAHAIEQAERNRHKIAVLFLDLNNFKHINDSLGHPVGDALLKGVASALNTCLRKGDTIGRFGGDEFIIIMEGIKDTRDINVIVQQVLEKVSQPFLAHGHEISTTTSIGIAIFPDDAVDVDSLLKNADVAMYRAKARGGSNFQFFTQDMSEQAVERLRLQHYLSRALERHEFKLYYQPKMDMASGRISGMEALLRWDSPELGLITPNKFIPILEETGRIIEVGHWVIQNACEFNAHLHKMGYSDLRVSINLSARQFQDENLISTIKNAFLACEFNESHLEIEITESLLVDNMERAIDVLHSLHKIGATISIDDFGTGYSSMSYLKRLPIDGQKIDRSFVHDIPANKDDIAIAKAIIALGENLDLKIVAEGIETEEQLAFFKDSNCTEAQGFLISRPLPEDQFIEFLKDYEKSNSTYLDRAVRH